MTESQKGRTIGSQRERFIEAARHLGADEDEATFKAKMAVIARQKVKDEVKPPKSKTKKAAP